MICLYCNSEKVIKKGFSKGGKQRYKCKNCNKKFTKDVSVKPEKSKKDIEKEQKEIERQKQLKENIDLLLAKRKPIDHTGGSKFKFGIISDTHIGSLYENPHIVETLYRRYKKEGIDTVYHSGDMIDGHKMFRGHEFEVHALGLFEQVSAVTKSYPVYIGITTYFITGSHDLSFHKIIGQDPAELISAKRKDLIYIGREQADIEVAPNVIMRLIHPSKGTAYALSYHPQKYIESLSGGRKPEILIIGHYHKAELLPCYRNIFSIQAGCTQSQTPFMARNNLAAHTGGWIIEGTINKKKLISSFKAEFIAFYEEDIRK